MYAAATIRSIRTIGRRDRDILLFYRLSQSICLNMRVQRTSFYPLPLCYWEGAAWRLPNVRASNEDLPRPRVARAQGIARPPFLFFTSLSSLSHWRGHSAFFTHPRGGGQMVLDCAHRGTTVLSWGLCEQEGPSGCSIFLPLLLPLWYQGEWSRLPSTARIERGLF